MSKQDGRVGAHIITLTVVLKHTASVSDPDRLLGQKSHTNLHGETRNVGVGLDVDEELRRSYECSCGKRFLKARTASKHLREVRPTDGECSPQ